MTVRLVIAGFITAILPIASYAQTGNIGNTRTGSSANSSTRRASQASNGTSRTQQNPFQTLQIGSDAANMTGTSPFATQALSQTTSQSGATGARSNTSRNSLGNLSRLSSANNTNRGGLSGLNNMNMLDDDPSDYRSSIPRIIQIGFDVPPTPIVSLKKEYATSIPKALPGSRDLGMTVVNGTATITGKVASQRDKELAGAVLSLEPGINSVINKLEVIATPTKPAALTNPIVK